jgi:hypothetical protein
MGAAALVGAAGGYAAARGLATLHPLLEAAVVAAVFGALYLAAAAAFQLEQARGLLRRARRRAP